MEHADPTRDPDLDPTGGQQIAVRLVGMVLTPTPVAHDRKRPLERHGEFYEI
jgi:hypothetical protein